ncbi:MAG: glycosyltransferase [Pyrinomonadaceae bacterium]
MKKYSIVIPALNEADNIASCVQAAAAQTINRADYEIVVVDNGSTDKTAEAALLAGADKVVVETHRGTNFARQRGLEECSGDLIAFLDADSRPPKDWLERAGVWLSDPHVKAISGPCDFDFTGLPWFVDLIYARHFITKLDRLLFFVFRRKAGALMGGNFVASKETLDAIGGFPPFTFHGDDSAVAMLISRKVGRVVWDGDFRVKSSARRFEREGHLRLVLTYAWYYMKNYFFLNIDSPGIKEIRIQSTQVLTQQ